MPVPPVAAVKPIQFEKHGDVRVDHYAWLSKRDDPEVLAYLNTENEYAKAVMNHVAEFEQSLFEEIKGRIKPKDLSVPFKLDDYYYYTRFEEGKEYLLYCRKHGSLDGDEEIMLDVNQLAEGHEFFDVGALAVSFGQDLLAYAVDTQGRRIYTIHIRYLANDEMIADVIPDVTGNMAWANDNRTLFYSKQDISTLRPYQIWRHTVGDDPTKDVLAYEEADDTFVTSVFKTKSKQYLMIASHQTVSSEYRLLDANEPAGLFQVVAPRQRGHEYDVDHAGEMLYIRTNDQAKNFRLMVTSIHRIEQSQWKEIIPHRPDTLLESFELFQDHLVVGERKDGLTQLRVIPFSGEETHVLDFGEPTYWAAFGDNHEMQTHMLRFVYMSMTTPHAVYDYDMVTREKTLCKQDEILGGFDQTQYQTERIWAKGLDGMQVPISLVYRKGLLPDKQKPLLLYGYGSYGISMDANFSSPRLSLLDRGFVFAIAHIRGGEELGRQWYDDGKLMKKRNTFTDFIACAEHLLREGYACKEKLFAMGGSAGGLLMGAVMNMRPDLFHGIVAQVPFVDVITTMLDPTLPLTTGEYDEWGNPNDQEAYHYIRAYSPYDNLEATAYPHLLVTTGLHDSQVQYWEPAKWVAKLRTLTTNQKRLLLKTNMEAGHGGMSGRFRRYRELAWIYAFLCDLAGIRC
ncbi:MAG: prolyl oligopeptidase family serine peptidase [Nitrospirales bacterium]|nr:prolyl oligopeptidase family serine peptidase [Nitrospirales bacterium]